MDALRDFLAGLEARMKHTPERGQVARYIPELAQVDPNQFGISACLAGGQRLSAGHAAAPFSIQSISKVFALAIAPKHHGDRLWRRVGKEPSNYAFNSVIELEKEHGKPRNPLVNAGAIVTTDALRDAAGPDAALDELPGFVRTAASTDAISINEEVAASEYQTAYRNFARAYFLRSCGNLQSE